MVSMGNGLVFCLLLPRSSPQTITSSLVCSSANGVVWTEEKKKFGGNWCGAIIDPAAPHSSLLLPIPFGAVIVKCVSRNNKIRNSLFLFLKFKNPVAKQNNIQFESVLQLDSCQIGGIFRCFIFAVQMICPAVTSPGGECGQRAPGIRRKSESRPVHFWPEKSPSDTNSVVARKREKNPLGPMLIGRRRWRRRQVFISDCIVGSSPIMERASSIWSF